MNLKRMALNGAVAALTVSATVLVATPASAAAYNGACGSGYKVVNSRSAGSLGTVYLTYNSSNGYNCVITIRNSKGKATRIEASVKRRSVESWTFDGGSYTTFAGPVYTYGSNSCIDWGGLITNMQNSMVEYGTNCG